MNEDLLLQLVLCLFQPIFTVALFVMFWGVDVHIFDAAKIDYHSALSLVATEKTVAKGSHFITGGLLAALGVVLCEYLWAQATGKVDVGGVFGFLFVVCAILFALPLGLRYRHNMDTFRSVLLQVVWPTQPVEFCHVFVADALTSLSSSLRDLARAGLLLFDLYLNAYFLGAVDGQVAGDDDLSTEDSTEEAVEKAILATPLHQTIVGITFVELMACSPYILRMQQCYLSRRLSTSVSHRRAQLLNFFKYATAIPIFAVGVTSAIMKKHGREDQILSLAYLLLLARSVNSCYSLFWDLVMDWGLFSPVRRARKLIKAEDSGQMRCFFPTFVYVLAAVLDLVTRFAWIVVLIPSLGAIGNRDKMEETTEEPAPNEGAVEAEVTRTGVTLLFGWSLFFHVVEVFRRSMWNIVRVEWEVLHKQGTKRLEPTTSPGDKEVGLNAEPLSLAKVNLRLPSSQARERNGHVLNA